VHGDLSEYNILVVPCHFVDHRTSNERSSMDELQAVLIDFGQAVDTKHPSALELLERDVDRVLSFFNRQEAITMLKEEVLALILKEGQR
jgi:serine/threonine-protein kinase RIO1